MEDSFKINTRFSFFTPRSIRPEGWLKNQLRIQAQGLSGNLDKVWPDIRDSRWIGGDRDGWERVPYWLDGFIPLAWLLDDEDLKQRASRYIDAILSRQEEDGWICPCPPKERSSYDVWVVFLVCKVLVSYHDCTQDERIFPAVYGALKNLYFHLDKRPLFDWGAARWFECLIPLFWLYEKKPEKWMLDLAFLLKIEGFDYETLFRQWRFSSPEKRWNQQTHVVNLAMALKSHCLYSLLTGEDKESLALDALQVLRRDHGTAYDHFTGDECLAGTSPTRGSELCSVVEAMYSYERLYAATGNPYWADCLERLGYNALPAAISPDMWSHQYDQMVNQIQCSPLPEDKSPFGTNNGEAHLFGLEPHFGCCTSNFSQGWPKLALSTFFSSPEGIAVGAIAPASLNTVLGESKVSLQIITQYPFRDSYQVVVSAQKPVEFCLWLRTPGSAKSCRLDGKDIPRGSLYPVKKIWSGRTVLDVDMDFEPVLTPRPEGLYCINRGPLLFSLPIKEEWIKREYTKDKVERRFPYCDYELLPKSPWNYGFDAFKAEELPVRFALLKDCPFSPDQAPVTLTVPLYPIPWSQKDGVCARFPDSLTPCGPLFCAEFIPYGCTNLRMTEMPVIRQ